MNGELTHEWGEEIHQFSLLTTSMKENSPYLLAAVMGII